MCPPDTLSYDTGLWPQSRYVQTHPLRIIDNSYTPYGLADLFKKFPEIVLVDGTYVTGSGKTGLIRHGSFHMPN